MRALCLVSVTALLLTQAAQSRATVLRGDVSGVITLSGTIPPGLFGLAVDPTDPYVNNGLPVSVRFWLDTDLVPSAQPSGTGIVDYEELNPAEPWLRVEFDVNGIVTPIEGDYLYFSEGRDPEEGFDWLILNASGGANGQGVQVTVRDADFGFGPAPWTDLEVVGPKFYSPASFSALYPPDFQSGYFIDFQPTSLSLHPVPEPGGVTLIALAALAVVRLRRMSR
jgi:hypothetical protein